MKRAQVDQALAVTRSELAKAATDRYDLALDQAAAIAEFDTPDTVKALVAAHPRAAAVHHCARRAGRGMWSGAGHSDLEADHGDDVVRGGPRDVWAILRYDVLDSRITLVTPRAADDASTTPADSIATSVPAPMAIPTSPWASAGRR